ncbi:NAD(P)-dependent oxidoreductase [Novosphingobium sp. M1R2S20]|uniref:NAD(P)-dependent oxidoreductase n=1 Tax=Novosphingobium rhizovicinum TaxID=3228928 RepID=A0ABV3RCI1_9SPHN
MQGAVGFVGLGVMGEPMCRNLARKCGRAVIGFDRVQAPLDRLAADGVQSAADLRALAAQCAVVLLSLPSAEALEVVCAGPEGLLATMRPGQVLVDMSTSPVALTRELAAAFEALNVRYADAPIARTRQAAEDGTLAIMVGADEALFAQLHPLLACMGTEITHCGTVGSGQVVKLLNNMVMMETVVAFSEALAIARRAGVDGALLFDAFTKSSADSFALRHHGMKAVLPDNFPERAFSAIYARKDLDYALALAGDTGVRAEGAKLADRLLAATIERGDGDRYWPVVSRVIDQAR